MKPAAALPSLIHGATWMSTGKLHTALPMPKPGVSRMPQSASRLAVCFAAIPVLYKGASRAAVSKRRRRVTPAIALSVIRDS